VRSRGIDENLADLEHLDPGAAARLHAGDTSRIARALEVVLSTGRTLQDWQAERKGGLAGAVALRPLILLPPRDWLHARCDARFVAMIDGGAITEAERLLARGLDPRLPVMRAIGVSEIAAFLAGDMNRDQLIAAGQQATRRYAKRQYTWFAHQPPPQWPRFIDPLESGGADLALALLGQKP
jgi:tRNA dimethylallyltransferase